MSEALLSLHLLHHVIDMHDYIKRNTALHIKSLLCSINRLTTFTARQAQFMRPPPLNDIVGEFGFHAWNTANSSSKRA